MLGKKIVAALAVGALGLCVNFASADSITVHNYGTPSIGATSATYTYEIQFDSQANVQTGDGFVIYDFPDLTGVLFAPDPTTPNIPTADFTVTTGTSNTLNDMTKVNAEAGGQPGGTFTDANDIVAAWTGATDTTQSYILLQVTTSDTAASQYNSLYAGSVDNSNTNAFNPLGFLVAGPSAATSVPLPMSSVSSIALIGVFAVGRLVKRDRCNA